MIARRTAEETSAALADGEMIVIRGRPYELPRALCLCPRCSGDELIWDGHWSWRCAGGCRYPIPLSAIFADDTLSVEFDTTDVDLERLTLTPEASALIAAGHIHLSQRWTPRGRAQAEDEKAYLRHIFYGRLMRMTPAQTKAESQQVVVNEEDPDE